MKAHNTSRGVKRVVSEQSANAEAARDSEIGSDVEVSDSGLGSVSVSFPMRAPPLPGIRFDDQDTGV